MACGCFGGSHLWHDMGLSGRQVVSLLLEKYFLPFYRANSNDMKWKKVFYHELCKRLDLHSCLGPACAECDNYGNCYDTEALITWF